MEQKLSKTLCDRWIDAATCLPAPNSGNLTKTQITTIYEAFYACLSAMADIVKANKGLENMHSEEFQLNPSNKDFQDALSSFSASFVAVEGDGSAARNFFLSGKANGADLFYQTSRISNRP
jgi:hypothetical protein